MEDISIEFDCYRVRELKEEDISNYYKILINSDREAKYFTGTVIDYSEEQIEI